MKQWDTENLLEEGYKIYNGIVKSVQLRLEDHDILTLYLWIRSEAGELMWGGRSFGSLYQIKKGVHSSTEDNCLAEYLLNIFDTLGVRGLDQLEGCHVRIAYKERRQKVSSILGNILENKWFDSEEFVKEFYNKEDPKDDY